MGEDCPACGAYHGEMPAAASCAADHDYVQLEGIRYEDVAGILRPVETVVCCRRCAESVRILLYPVEAPRP